MSPGWRLIHYVLQYRRAFLQGLGCVVASVSLTLAGPWILRYAIDDLRDGMTRALLWRYAGLLLGVAAVAALFRFLMRRIIVGASRELEYGLRNEYFLKLQHLDVAYFQQHRTGDLMSRATNDLNAVRMMIGPAVMYTANTVLTFVAAIILMGSMHARLTVIALIPLPLVTLAVRYFGAAVHRRFERIQAQLSDISAVLQETLAGVRVVRAYNQEPFEVARFRAANEEYVRRNRALIQIQGVFHPSIGLLMGMSALLVLWLGSREVVAGQMTVGELVAFNAYVVMLAWPMIAFGWVTNLLQRGMASWERLLEVLDAEPQITDPVATASDEDLPAIRGDIELRHLSFAYGDTPVLEDVSVRIPAGTTTAIVGATGSGKSSLLSLLPRLADPPPGTVFVDGRDVRDWPLARLRGAIGFVQQEPFLFSTTVAENIGSGVSSTVTTDEGVATAAHMARLDHDVEAWPRGYDTVVGERGITLSGGQKQRAALARALIRTPRILVLDDALSAVDTYTEEEILTGLRADRQRRTTLLVSHRVSTVRDADQILVMDQGRVVERGTHDELVAAGGVYAELDRKQQLEAELAAS